MEGKNLWRIGIGLGAGWIAFDRFLHILPDWLSIILFLVAWILIISGLWKERVKEL